MFYNISINVEGPKFDPQLLFCLLPEELKGSVGSRRRGVRGRSNTQLTYWQSTVISTEEFAEIPAISLIEAYRAFLLEAKKGGGNVSMQISCKYATGDDPMGFYVPTPLIRILAELDADLDFSPELRLSRHD